MLMWIHGVTRRVISYREWLEFVRDLAINELEGNQEPLDQLWRDVMESKKR